MNEINLKTKTVKVPKDNSYSIEDMERMFGKRIAKAINTESNKNNRVYKAIITKEMTKICKPWKFWNADIRKAYKNYVGMIIVPWVIVNESPVIMCDPKMKKYYNKKINMSKYNLMTL